MPELTLEQRAREQIDAMLTASGWAVQNYRAFNPSASRWIALREVPLKSGRSDLLLADEAACGVPTIKQPSRTAFFCRTGYWTFEQYSVTTSEHER